MATRHDPPRASKGERIQKGRGRAARKPGQTKRQRSVDPEKLRVVREMMIGTDYYEMQFVLAERWGLSTRTIRWYRSRVLEMMREEIESDGFLNPDMETQLALQQLEAARLRAIAAKDVRAEVACIRLRAQIAGVLGPDKHLHVYPQAPSPPPAQPTEAVPDPAYAARLEVARRVALQLGAKGAVIDMKPAPTAPQEATVK